MVLREGGCRNTARSRLLLVHKRGKVKVSTQMLLKVKKQNQLTQGVVSKTSLEIRQ
jgi:hypothetical protein